MGQWAPAARRRASRPQARFSQRSSPPDSYAAPTRAWGNLHPHPQGLSVRTPNSGVPPVSEGCVRSRTLHWLLASTAGLIVTGAAWASPHFEAKPQLREQLRGWRGSGLATGQGQRGQQPQDGGAAGRSGRRRRARCALSGGARRGAPRPQQRV